MRGSLRTQITTALKSCCRIGESRHRSKQIHGGKSPYVHAVGTFNKVAQRLWPLKPCLLQRGIRDLELLSGDLAHEYLEERLRHHLDQGNSRQSFKVEVAALGNLERGLNMFSEKFRSPAVLYDFSCARKAFTHMAKILPPRTSTFDSRALPEPWAVIAALEEPQHRLMASLQLQCGCRTEGVGAPQREYPGGNPLMLSNFKDEDDQILLPEVDPITGTTGKFFWTREKGGKVAWKFCPLDLAQAVEAWLNVHPEGLQSTYRAYLHALNRAMQKTGQFVPGRGTHALRFCFAQRRYHECILAGLGDEEAKLHVSREMSHARPIVTQGYCQ